METLCVDPRRLRYDFTSEGLCNLRTRGKQLVVWQFLYKVNMLVAEREWDIQVRVIIRGHMTITSNN